MKINTKVKVPVDYLVADWARAVSHAVWMARAQGAWSWTAWLRTDLDTPGNLV